MDEPAKDKDLLGKKRKKAAIEPMSAVMIEPVVTVITWGGVFWNKVKSAGLLVLGNYHSKFGSDQCIS